MPFYEYHCDKCGDFEVKENMLNDRLTICPTCGGQVYQKFYPPEIRWLGNFRWMKGNFKIPPALGE